MNKQNGIFFCLKYNKLDQNAGRILPVTSQKCVLESGKHFQNKTKKEKKNKKTKKQGEERKRKKVIRNVNRQIGDFP